MTLPNIWNNMIILLDFRTSNLWRVTFCVHTFSVRSAAFGEERRSDRRRNGFDVWRMAVASVSQGSHLAGTVHQEQMRRRFDHSTTRHYRRPLSTRVNIKSYVILYNIICDIATRNVRQMGITKLANFLI